MTKGSQRPRVERVPRAAESDWDLVRDLCESVDLHLDPWQLHVLRGALGVRDDGRWAAPQVALSVPRQSGKTAILEARTLASLLLFEDERLIVHSAHQVPTALEAFRRVRHYFENYDDLRKRVKAIRLTNGEQTIELLDGKRLRIVARSRQAIRGWSPDVLLLDEAQILGEQAWAAMLPSISARPNPQVWMTGTPPGPGDDGEVFGRLRDSALRDSEHSEGVCFMEWSADPADDLDDPETWARANPSLNNGTPHGVRLDAVRGERASTDDDTFARERLGIWEVAAARHVIDPAWWDAAEDPDSKPASQLALGIDVSPDRSTASVALAGLRADGLWHAELYQSRPGALWIPAWVKERVAENPGKVRSVVIDGASPAASLVDDLKRLGVRVTTTQLREYAGACGSFYDLVAEGRLRHPGQPQLTFALAGARTRTAGDAWAWNRKTPSSDITPVVAATLALHGAQTSKAVRPTRTRSGSGAGRALVLS